MNEQFIKFLVLQHWFRIPGIILHSLLPFSHPLDRRTANTQTLADGTRQTPPKHNHHDTISCHVSKPFWARDSLSLEPDNWVKSVPWVHTTHHPLSLQSLPQCSVVSGLHSAPNATTSLLQEATKVPPFWMRIAEQKFLSSKSHAQRNLTLHTVKL